MIVTDWLADEIVRRWETKFTPKQRAHLARRIYQRIHFQTGEIWWGEIKYDARSKIKAKVTVKPR